MNILILNWRDPKNPKAGGAELVTEEYARSWIQGGHTVDWLSATFPKALPTEIHEKITIFRRGNVLSLFLWAPFFYLISKKKYHLVVDEIHGLPFMTPLYVQTPILAFIHEVAGDIWSSMYPFPLNKIGLFLEKVCFLFYKNITFLTVSESTKKDLRNMGVKHIAVIPNGLLIPRVPPREKEKDPTFIFVSRLVKMKGIEDILKAFERIHQQLPSAILWIVGGGNEKYIQSLKSLASALNIIDNVMFFGKVTNEKKYELLAKAHILLHASMKEGWGLVVVEAASQQTPSVVYNVSGLRDSVNHNKTGVIVKNNTPEYLAREAISLYRDKNRYKQFQENCLNYAQSLTWDKSKAASIKLIQSL